MIEIRSTCMHTIVIHTTVCDSSDDPAQDGSGGRPYRHYLIYNVAWSDGPITTVWSGPLNDCTWAFPQGLPGSIWMAFRSPGLNSSTMLVTFNLRASAVSSNWQSVNPSGS